MSRIAKMGVSVPTGVDVQLKDNLITVKGTGGELKLTPNPLVKITSDNGKLSFVPVDESREANAMVAGSQTADCGTWQGFQHMDLTGNVIGSKTM